MKAKQLMWIFLVLTTAAIHLSAQSGGIEDTKAKAASGDFLEQRFLGMCYANGWEGVAKDKVEAVKWFRKAAEQNYADAQCDLGDCYRDGEGVDKDIVEAEKWYSKAAAQGLGLAKQNLQNVESLISEQQQAKYFEDTKVKAEQGDANAQSNLGFCYESGRGVEKNVAEAVKWYRKAAEQTNAYAQYNLGVCYMNGEGVEKDIVEATAWYRKAAGQNVADAQYALGLCYTTGEGILKDSVEGYKWMLLAAANGCEDAVKSIPQLENSMTPDQIAEGQKLAREFKLSKGSSNVSISSNQPVASGTGFFITDDGYLISNYHVVKDATKVRLLTGAGLIDAKVVEVDAANDLALLKADGRFAPLAIAASRTVALGGTVATVGFPDIGLQGFAPKLAKGEIASLSGAGDDPRYFQISVPVQPGNSGGALVDERGNVIGIVSAKLDASAALAASGQLPENVNYAVKSSLLLSFLESVPDVDARLKSPNVKDEKFEDVVKSAQDAAVLVLVY
jgi:TPR repeat protein